MHFTISDSTLEQVQEELTLEAIDKFKTKAAKVAERFDNSSYIIINVNIVDNYLPPQPMMKRSFMSAEMADAAPPALDGGTNKVTVSISGQIELL
jgi:predicted secreted protein